MEGYTAEFSKKYGLEDIFLQMEDYFPSTTQGSVFIIVTVFSRIDAFESFQVLGTRNPC